MDILQQCEAAMRSGAGPYDSVYVGSGHPYVSDHELAEWLRPHGTEEIRQHAIALGDVQRARDTLRLALIDYVHRVEFFEPSFVTTPADYRRR